MLHINENSQDLLSKLEAVRLVCRTSGCAQRYLTHDALNGIFQATGLTDDRHDTDYSQRFLAYMHDVQDRDLTLGVAMTDAKATAPSGRCPSQSGRLCAHQSAVRTASSSGAPRLS